MNAIIRHSAAGLICGVAAYLFSLLPIGRVIELKGYDLLHLTKVLSSPPENIVIVAVDEPSFAEFQKQWPWPRSMHARLVDALKKAGASVIGIDILFPEPSKHEEDIAFADALRRAGNVVLASDVNVSGSGKYDQEMLIEPIPEFLKHAATGIVSIPLDRDYVVRRPPQINNKGSLFSEKIASLYALKTKQPAAGALISYVGPPNSFTTVSYYQAIDPQTYLPEGFFEKKMVLVGKASNAAAEPENVMQDYFATPFLLFYSAGNSLMSGVEIHANLINNFLTAGFVRELSSKEKLMLFMILGLWAGFLQIRWRPFFGFFVAAASFFAYIGAAFYIFAEYKIWMPTFAAILPFLFSYAVSGINAYVASESKKKEIKKAFSRYVSPAVLESVLSDPESLKLGGRETEVTILFSDIAGFTAISEKLSPEEVSHFLNIYLTEMTGIVLEHKGTIDKFIGDAVMAFWGAPAADPEHALNACRAAVSMQERLKSLRSEFNQQGLPEINVRIGINTGMVIAGNMGSETLFDYTVIGDPVNLASRLEGANKQFGTNILISEYVYEKVSDKVKARPLGKITVKGKTQEVAVYDLVKVTV